MRLDALARALGCTLEGDGSAEVTGVAPIETAGPGDLTFLHHPRYLQHLATTRAAAVILAPGADRPPCPALRHEIPYLAFAAALRLFFPESPRWTGVHPQAAVAATARLAAGVAVGAFAVIEDGAAVGEETQIGPQVYIGRGSRIGRACLLYPQVVIREGVQVGDRVIVHSGAVVGGDGFGYARDARGRYQKVPQVGGVIIEDDVEVGANVTVDRATLGATRIGRGTKIDNLVQIAHNVVVGEDSVIVAQAGIAGSTQVGRQVTIAGQAGLVGHLRIGDGSVIGSQAGVGEDLPAGAMVLGSPAVPHMTAKRIWAAWLRLPDLLRRVRDLERRLEGGGKRTGEEEPGR
ncbi:MAG: UDP-3-O-(3-hydroxymyristoyl)glucosamine N-acyltransferase [candidate division NC10 bacterium]|nr:UDP-3-O-(3-hydroxymyristoyl)glucosamine N-acyltransferase [candidate division NC10 bacterium]